MKKIVILGSTGSIGRQAIEIILNYQNLFRVVGLSCRSNISLLTRQIKDLQPKAVAVFDELAAKRVKENFSGKDLKIYSGEEGLIELATSPQADFILNALVGSVGLIPTLKALEAGKILALANKESLVVGGDIVMPLVKEKKLTLLPVDSEHSAIFQCLQGEEGNDIEKIILTASGGPFRGWKREDLVNVSIKDALKHPRWKMGKKVTIDAGTLMNKGLEIIEAHHFFSVPYEKIGVVIHPQSIIHSLVELADGSVLAHLSHPDMRIPIQFALSYPRRLKTQVKKLDLITLKELTFEKPDAGTFPCLKYAREAGVKGLTYPSVLNAANEEAVRAFLDRKISFLKIPEIIYQCLEDHHPEKKLSLENILKAEEWTREKCREIIKNITTKSRK